MCIPKNSDSFITSSMVAVRVDVEHPLADPLVVGEEFGRQHPRSAVAGLEEPLAQDHSQVGGELAPDEIVVRSWEETRQGG